MLQVHFSTYTQQQRTVKAGLDTDCSLVRDHWRSDRDTRQGRGALCFTLRRRWMNDNAKITFDMLFSEKQRRWWHDVENWRLTQFQRELARLRTSTYNRQLQRQQQSCIWRSRRKVEQGRTKGTKGDQQWDNRKVARKYKKVCKRATEGLQRDICER